MQLQIIYYLYLHFAGTFYAKSGLEYNIFYFHEPSNDPKRERGRLGLPGLFMAAALLFALVGE